MWKNTLKPKIFNNKDKRRGFYVLAWLLLSKHFNNRRWGWVWEWGVTIDFKNRMAFVHYTVHMNCIVHYNCCMAVKQ